MDPKTKKKLLFLKRNFFISLLTKKMLNVKSCNLYTTWVEIESVCVPSLSALSHVTEISEAENGQNVVNFEVVYLGKWRYSLKKVCGF